MSGQVRKVRFCMYTSSLPAYREHFLRGMRQELGQDWTAFCGQGLLGSNVETDVPAELYVAVRNIPLARGKLLLQVGHWRAALGAEAAIVEMTPRSLTAWLLLVGRRLLRRRTVVWGQLHPRAGADANTAGLRRTMRWLANGSLVYTYREAVQASQLSPRGRVWAAPNALYRADEIWAPTGGKRDSVLYVGRLVGEKKPQLLLQAFREVADKDPDVILTFVGTGPAEAALRSSAAATGFSDRIRFLGGLTAADELRAEYARARCSVSPGYAGLSVTQSLGFGVPMVIAADEKHSPEIEVATGDSAIFFERDSPTSLAAALLSMPESIPAKLSRELAGRIRDTYSVEAMVAGFVAALRSEP